MESPAFPDPSGLNLAALTDAEVIALLDWQRELGADEAMVDAPVNRFSLVDEAPRAASPRRRAEPAAPDLSAAPPPGPDPVAEARAAAAGARTLEDLAAAMAGFDHLDLKRGARNFVFADGNPKARVMVIGEAPGAEEDREGRPFVGRAGQLLDLMFAAIGLSRTTPAAESALYITNVLPWRPPGNRDPEPAEIAMMRPFLERHVALADPDVIVLMGNIPCDAVLGQRGILRLRGQWTTGFGKPAMPMTHPSYLLRNPAAKREAWADLLEILARLTG